MWATQVSIFQFRFFKSIANVSQTTVCKWILGFRSYHGSSVFIFPCVLSCCIGVLRGQWCIGNTNLDLRDGRMLPRLECAEGMLCCTCCINDHDWWSHALAEH